MTNAEKKLATIEDFLTNHFDADTSHDSEKRELIEMLDHVCDVLGTVDGTLANTPEVQTDDDAPEDSEEAQDRKDDEAKEEIRWIIINALASHYGFANFDMRNLFSSKDKLSNPLEALCFAIHDEGLDLK